MTELKQLDPRKLTEGLTKKFADRIIFSGAVSTLPAGEAHPTGSLLLDKALGCGGIPKGRLIELYGPESSGKTALAILMLTSIQRAGGTVAYIDLEQTFDKVWAANLGLDTDRCVLVQPANFEGAMDALKWLAENGVDGLVFDSVAAGVTTAEAKGDAGDATVGVKARIMSKMTSALLPILRRTGGSVIFINQVREKVGVMYGSPETTPGGRALKFNASVRMRLHSKYAKEGDEPIGLTIQVTMVKNKVAPPYKKCELTLLYGTGFDSTNELIEIGKSMEIIQVNAASHTILFGAHQGEKFIGRAKLLAFLQENPAAKAELQAEVSRRLQSLDLSLSQEEEEAAKKENE